MRKIVAKFSAAASAVGASLVIASPALATGYLDTVASSSGLGNTSLPTLVGTILQFLLSLLGIILFGMILYAGFMWMTAGGDPKKVQTAKDYIRDAVIGLLLILAALSISNFVFSQLISATGANSNITQVQTP